MMAEVKLHGLWASPFSCMVTWALKLKDIPFDFIEEDLSNKSPLLLQYNPVYKKIPVLAHNGKPICESMLIVEYLEEMWPQNYPLLPSDPYQRAQAKFWVKFADDKCSLIWMIYRNKGEGQKKAIKNCIEMLQLVEKHCLEKDKVFFGGDKVSMVDIALGGIAYWLEMIEDIIGLKLIEPHSFPALHVWILNFKQVPVIKDNLPDYRRLLDLYKSFREVFLVS